MPHPPQIPLTPQTDERNFPRWEGEKAAPGRPGARYPKMLTRTVTREDRDQWVERHRRVDQTTRQEYWEESPPRVGAQMPIPSTQAMVDEGLVELANQSIVVNDAEEEARIRVFLGLDQPVNGPQTSTIPIRAEMPIALTAPSPDWVEEEPIKKRGRPKGSKNKIKE